MKQKLITWAAVFALVFALLPSSPVSAVVITGSISGNLTNSSSTSVPNTSVCAVDLSDYSSHCSMTDAQGNYSIAGLIEGNYRIRFSPNFQSGYVGIYYPSSFDQASATPVALTAGELKTGINGILPLGGSLQGSIVRQDTGAALSGASFNLVSNTYARDEVTFYATSNSLGQFTISGVAAGTYKLFVDRPSGTNFKRGWYGGNSFSTATEISISAGTTTGGISIALPSVESIPDSNIPSITQSGTAISWSIPTSSEPILGYSSGGMTLARGGGGGTQFNETLTSLPLTIDSSSTLTYVQPVMASGNGRSAANIYNAPDSSSMLPEANISISGNATSLTVSSTNPYSLGSWNFWLMGDTADVWSRNNRTTSPSNTYTGLIPGTTYTVFVAGCRTLNTSAISDCTRWTSQSFTTPSRTSEGKPTNVRANWIGPRMISLKWNAPTGSTEDYVVETSVNGQTWVTFADGVSTYPGATITGLEPTLNYVFRVSAVQNGTRGSPSNWRTDFAQKFSASFAHTCAIDFVNNLYCWGYNSSGQLGTGTTTSINTPNKILSDQDVVSVSTSSSSSCAVLNSGELKCWGAGTQGQLGRGNTAASSTPISVPSIPDAIAVSGGDAFNCAIRMTAQVYCWGFNTSGQLGNGTVTTSYSPVQVSGISNAVEISAGLNFACARLQDGTVKCWGGNNYGQLGNGSTTSSMTPTTVNGLNGVTQISVGDYTACALKTDGTIKCWGLGTSGELGNTTNSNSSSPVNVSAITTAEFVSVGSNHACGTLSDGAVKCWGNNGATQLGDGTSTYRNEPVSVSGLTGVIATIAGQRISCAITFAGYTTCWGDNSSAQFGDGSSTGASIANNSTISGFKSVVSSLPGPTISSVSLTSIGRTQFSVSWSATSSNAYAATTHEISLSTDGVNWQSPISVNNAGQVISGLVPNTKYFIKLRSASDAGWSGYFYAGFITTLPLDNPTNLRSVSSTGTTVDLSWTAPNEDPQLATSFLIESSLNGNTWIPAADVSSSSTSATVTGLVSGKKYLFRISAKSSTATSRPSYSSITSTNRISSGLNHTCLVESGGQVSCWGGNSDGQLGDGTTTNKNLATRVSGVSDAVSVSAGYAHSCAVTSEGSVFCWGRNNYGQLGNNNGANSVIPVQVSGISTAISVSAGQDHTCVLLANKTVICWGRNQFGQLGNGNIGTASYPTPFTVQGLGGVTQLTSVSNQNCALLDTGIVKCWGDNSYGQLGDGSTTARSLPTEVNSLTSAVEITTTWSHSCALLSNGSIKCWGSNNAGRLGNNSTSGSTIPVTVSGISDAISISAGASNTCAILTDRTLSCWGYNGFGSLGNGATSDSSSPTPATLASKSFEVTVGENFACQITLLDTVECWGRNNLGQLGNNKYSNSLVPKKILGLTSLSGPLGVPFSIEMKQPELTRNSAIVKWAVPNNGGSSILGYEISFSSDLGATWSNPARTSATSANLAVLEPGKKYLVKVRGENSTGWSEFTTDDFTTLSLDNPSNLRVTSRGVGSVSLRWDAPNQQIELVDDYKLEYSTDDITWVTFPDGTSTSTSSTITGLTLGASYFFRVSALSGQFQSEPATIRTKNLQISAGDFHACSLLETGTAQCWGYNDQGQLGYGTFGNPSFAKYSVFSLTDAIQLESGGEFSCALKNAGTVWCWGSNSYGQLGNATSGNTPNINQPVSGISSATEIALGSNSACAVLANGTVKCWGRNTSGALGNGTISQSSNIPVVVAGISNATHVAVGYQHACAVLSDKSVKCWGFNDQGQLGNGATATSSTPVAVTGLSSATQISAGANHTCVVNTDKSVSCWGQNGYGQLGLGDNSDKNVPVTVPNLADVSSISLGGLQSCAVQTSGLVYCWGRNQESQLGDGTTQNSNVPLRVDGLSNATDVAVGYSWVCAQTETQATNCWGSNNRGQLATNSSVPTSTAQLSFYNSLVPNSSATAASVQVGNIGSITRTSATISWSVTSNGGMDVTGYEVSYSSDGGTTWTNPTTTQATSANLAALIPGKSYQVRVRGQNPVGWSAYSTNSFTTTQLDNPTNVQLVSRGVGSIAVSWTAPDEDVQLVDDYKVEYSTDGTTWTVFNDGVSTTTSTTITGLTTGTNYFIRITALDGEAISASSQSTSISPAVIPRLSAIISSSVGRASAAISWSVSNNGGMDVTGYELSYSSDGGTTWTNPTTTQATSANLAALIPGKAYQVRVRGQNPVGWSAYSTTSFTTTALDNPTNVQLSSRGVGSMTVSWTAPDEDVQLVDDYKVEYSTDGTTWTVFNDGVSTTTSTTITGLTTGTNYYIRITALDGTAASLDSLSFPIQVDASQNFACSISEIGNKQCWGLNDSGQYGNGTTTSATKPKEVSSNKDITQIASGSLFSCNLRTNQQVWCSGNNSVGQLGNGNYVNSTSMVWASGFSAIQIAAGDAHACAITTSGGIKCWGSNTYGQLGSGIANANYATPLSVSGISNATQISAGNNHTCAVLADSTVKCWGFNNSGRLGNGTTTNSSVPVVVSGLSNVKQISAGGLHTCALLNTGSIRCWGYGGDSELGDGTTITKTSPISSVSGIADAVQVESGLVHSCALLSSGLVKCWGNSANGQLGNGSTNPSSTPVLVSGLTDAIQISAGTRTNCAVTSARKTYCWGDNTFGQTGIGTSATSEYSPRLTLLTFLPSQFAPATAPQLSIATPVPARTSSAVSWSVSISGGMSVTNYEISYSADGGTTWIPQRNSQSTNATIDNLTPGKSYLARVRGQNEVGWSPYAVASFTTISLDNPTNLRILNRGVGSIDLTWDVPDQDLQLVSDYKVEYSSDSGVSWTTLNDGVSTTNTATISGLVTGTNYYVRVSSLSPGAQSATTQISTSPATVPTIGTPTITGITRTTSTINWAVTNTGGVDVTDYEISYSGDSGTTWSNPVTTQATSANLAALTPGKTYQVKVRAQNAVGWSAYSTTSFTTTALDNPTNVVLSSRGVESITINWTAPDQDVDLVDDYKVEYSTNGTTWTLFNDGVSTATAATITGLTTGTNYYFRVTALDGTAVSTSSQSSFLQSAAVATLSTLNASGTTRTQSIIDWSVADTGGIDVTNFEISYSGDSGTTWSNPVTTQATSANLAALTPGKTYQVKVRAQNAVGWSAYSTTSFTTTALDNPTNVVLSSRGVGSITINWTAPDQDVDLVDDYKVEYSTNGTTWTLFNDGVSTATAATITGLTTGTNYYFRVTALDGTAVSSSSATPIPRSKLSLGVAFSCFLFEGLVKCWGSNSSGQLGDGTSSNRNAPVSVADLSPVVDIATGGYHSCALLETGQIRCWGDNSTGQLGDGTYTSRTTPVLVSGISTAVSISAGNMHTCAVLSDATVKCWGYNISGRLGDGTSTTRSTPVSVSGITNAVQVSAGGQHTCAVLTDGAVKCWGMNSSGQLGRGNTTSSLTPVTISLSVQASKISAGGLHTCIQGINGTVWCWGQNSSGQLGDETNTNRTSAVLVSSVTSAADVAAGDLNSCSVLTDGSSKCWGSNAYGQLGDTTTTNRNTAVSVSGMNSAISIASGGNHSCVYTQTGSISCWGYNSSGQLGNSTTTNSSTPSTVSTIKNSGLQVATVANLNSLSSSGVTRTTAQIGWSVADNGGQEVSRFEIISSRDSGATWSDPVVSNSNSQTLTNLIPGSNYLIQVTAINSVGRSSVATTSFTTAPLDLPTNLQVTNRQLNSGVGSVTLVWNPPLQGSELVTDYLVEYSSNGTNWTVASRTPSLTTSQTIGNLSASSSYTFRVSSTEGHTFSQPLSANTPAITVPAQRSINVVSSSTSQLGVSVTGSYTNNDPLLNYVVQTSRDGASWTEVLNLPATNASTELMLISNLNPGSWYYVRLAATNIHGQSQWSTAVSQSTLGYGAMNLNIRTTSGSPVLLGSYSWSSLDGELSSSTPSRGSANGAVSFERVYPKAGVIRLTNGYLNENTLVSGSWAARVGAGNQTLQIPGTAPVLQTYNVRVLMPNGVPVPNADVTVTGLSSSITQSGFTYTSVDSAQVGKTDANGVFTARGYLYGLPQATVVYSDPVLTQRRNNVSLTSSNQNIELSYMPYLTVVEDNVPADFGDLVSIPINFVDPGVVTPASLFMAAVVNTPVTVSVIPPTNAPQNCAGAVLSTTLSNNGTGTLKVCATGSGDFHLQSSGAVSAGVVRLNVDRGAPTAVTGLTVNQTTDNTADLSWSPVSFDGGASVSAYQITATSGTKTKTWNLNTQSVLNQRAAQLSGLNPNLLWTFTVKAKNTYGTGPGASEARIIDGSPLANTSSPFAALTPARLADTRGYGTVDGQNPQGTVVQAGGILRVQILGRNGIPETGVGSVALNVTVVSPRQSGWLTVFPTGEAIPQASNLNFTAGQTIPNMVIAKVGADGSISISSPVATADIIVDIAGWFPDDGSLTALSPGRLADTRGYGTVDGQNPQSSPVQAGSVLRIPVLGRHGVPETGVGSVALNVTVVSPRQGGWLTVFPTGEAIPQASNLNFTAGQTIPNMVIAKVGADGSISISSPVATADIIVDIAGWFPDEGSFTSLSPGRLADTRGYGTVDGQNPQSSPVQAGSVLRIPVLGRHGVPETGVGSVALNVTVVSPRQGGWLTVFPTGEAIPQASNLNFTAGQTIPNMVIAKVGADGSISISSPVATADIIVDIAGWYEQ